MVVGMVGGVVAHGDRPIGVVGVVVRALRPADLVGEARQGDPVGAGVAVHPDVAAQRLVVPLQHQVGEFVAVADHLSHPDVEVRVLGGERPASAR